MEAAEQETLDTALVRVSQRALQPRVSAAAQLRMALQRPRNCGPNAAALLCAPLPPQAVAGRSPVEMEARRVLELAARPPLPRLLEQSLDRLKLLAARAALPHQERHENGAGAQAICFALARA